VTVSLYWVGAREIVCVCLCWRRWSRTFFTCSNCISHFIGLLNRKKLNVQFFFVMESPVFWEWDHCFWYRSIQLIIAYLMWIWLDESHFIGWSHFVLFENNFVIIIKFLIVKFIKLKNRWRGIYAKNENQRKSIQILTDNPLKKISFFGNQFWIFFFAA